MGPTLGYQVLLLLKIVVRFQYLGPSMPPPQWVTVVCMPCWRVAWSLCAPPPLEPTSWAAVFVWAIRRMVEGSEGVHLCELPPSALVRLGYSLQVHCTVVQSVEGVYYIVAESTGLPGGSPHALVLQSERHYTVGS